MRTLSKISLVALFICLTSIAAFSQAKSIKTVPDDALFHSEDDGFEISLPANMVRKQSLNQPGKEGRGYMWEFSDAIIVVGVDTNLKPVKNDTDVAAGVAAYKASSLKGDKILSESPASIGDYRGTSFVVDQEGNKNLIIALFWDKFRVILVGTNLTKNPEIQKLVLEAIQSFEFVN